jgi:hypothetical protein
VRVFHKSVLPMGNPFTIRLASIKTTTNDAT